MGQDTSEQLGWFAMIVLSMTTAVARSPIPWSPRAGLVAANGNQWLLKNRLSGAMRVRRIGINGAEWAY